MTDSGWRPLEHRGSSSGRPRSRSSWRPTSGNTPFTQLARVHAVSSLGDGLITIALAGSIFFSIEPSDARWRVAAYLLLTIAPFAVVTPILGPAIDRAKGGRQGMVIGSLIARSLVAFLMVRHIDSFFLFPEAFAMLVLQKGYAVSRAALVPAVCSREEELIEANSKLALLSSIGAMLGAAIGAVLGLLFGPAGAAALAIAAFAVGAFLATKLPQVRVAPEPVDPTEKLEVRGANIILGATATGILRGVVGFTTFLMAFHLRAGEDGIDRSEPGAAVGAALGTLRGIDVDGTPGPPTWHFGVVALAAGAGAIFGARSAPQLRERFSEERIVFGALVAVGSSALLAAWGGGVLGLALLAAGVGSSASIGKLGFDALVQRDAPEANHGRVFAKFEGRFQMMWAFGAFIPVVIPLGIDIGALLIAIVGGFSAVSYEGGRRTDRVKRSSRVRAALRDRVPEETVKKINNHAVTQRVRPVVAWVATRRGNSPIEDLGGPTSRRNKRPDHHQPSDHNQPPAPPPEVPEATASEQPEPTAPEPQKPDQDGQFRLWE